MEHPKSRFSPSPAAHRVLIDGKILAPNESPSAMIDRMVNHLFDIESSFKTKSVEIARLKSQFVEFLDAHACVMSTPIMTNSGLEQAKPLAACTVPAVNFTKTDWQKSTETIVNQFHADGIGTGFNLDECEDPIAVLHYLNQVAVAGAASGRENRPVGNMAVLSVHHPKIQEFVAVKSGPDIVKDSWKFNISIDATDEFIDAVRRNDGYKLSNGTVLTARAVMRRITMAAHACGDPGLVFLSRMNKHNPTPSVGTYTSTAPCGEVGLAPGESCQFGYINLAHFVQKDSKDSPVDTERLRKLVVLMTRALDNALEISMGLFHQDENRKVMRAKRKIGIGICGLADLLIILGIPYDSQEGRSLARDLVGFINYHSKSASHELAKTRGSFTAMNEDPYCKYRAIPGYLESRYSNISNRWVTKKDWLALNKKILSTKLLRNATTIALPPTGRSGLVIDASCGVEPLFSSEELNRQHITKHLTNDPQNRVHLKTALEIDPFEHLKMASSLQDVVDEAISKTINLPENTEAALIYDLYLRAHELNLKGITIYRNNCRVKQPRNLTRQIATVFATDQKMLPTI